MTKPILTALAAAALLASPSAIAASGPGLQLAQSGQVPEKCAQLTDPNERAACIREESSK